MLYVLGPFFRDIIRCPYGNIYGLAKVQYNNSEARDDVTYHRRHMHINLKGGRGIEAIKEFKNAGGTHVFIVSLPAGELGLTIRSPEDFRAVFDATVERQNRLANM